METEFTEIRDTNRSFDEIRDNNRIFEWVERLEIGINTLNHSLIAITTFYISWYSFYAVGFGEYQTYHAFFTTIGYQLFMSEGIMIFYSKNTYTLGFSSGLWKKRIHLAMTGIGSLFATYGIIMMIYNREITGRKHFHGTHAVSGIY